MDSVRGVPASPAGTALVSSFGLFQTFACYFSKYPREIGEQIVHAWCHRMSWLAQLWVDSGFEEEFNFSDEVIASYREDPSFKKWASQWPKGSNAQIRIEEMRKRGPRGRQTYLA